MLKIGIVGALVFTMLGCTQPETVKNSGSGGATGITGSGGGGDTGGSSPGSGGSGSGATGGTSQNGAGGSGQGVSTTQSALSGSRLKAYWVTASDGSQEFASLWRDTQLNIDCNFTIAPDGQWRCLPTMMPTSLFYSDSGCSTPLGYFPCASQTQPGYISVPMPSSGTCSQGSTSIHTRGAQYTGAVYEGTPSACSSASSSLTAPYLFYSLGSPADLTTFQAGSYGYQ